MSAKTVMSHFFCKIAEPCLFSYLLLLHHQLPSAADPILADVHQKRTYQLEKCFFIGKISTTLGQRGRG